ncbi:MAG: hypothetical protein ACOX75_01175 [Lachnospiraceae bacterium]|jgi:hypothetical protein
MSIKDFFKAALSMLLLFSGLTGLVMIFFVTASRLYSVNTSYIITIICAVMMVVYSLINLISGISALASKTIRRAARVRPFVQIAAIIAIVQLILSATNGILLSHLIILGIAGVLIPELFFLLIDSSLTRS